MPHGIEVYGPGGELVMGTTTSTGQILGSISIPHGASLSGSVVDARFAMGRPFFWIKATREWFIAYDWSATNVTGTTISYNITVTPFSNALSPRPLARIIYGIY